MTELHEAGTQWAHYYHPSESDPTKCERCDQPVAVESCGAPQVSTHFTRPLAVGTVEQRAVLDTFAELLRDATADGGRKRAAGTKPPWWRDGAHIPAIFSHLNKWVHGERADPDSGAHPLVHLAWRALAIAYQETRGQVDPAGPCVPLPYWER